MRVKIIGSTESARVIRGYLEKAGVAVCHLPRFALHCTIHLSEHSGQHIIVDSVDSLLELHVLRHISELSKKDIILRRGTESPAIISSANEIHISIPVGEPELAHAAEVGVLRGVQRAHFHRPWWRRLLPLVALAFLLPGVASAQYQTGNTTTRPFSGVPSGACNSFQFAVDTTTGDFYNCLFSAWRKISSGGGASSFDLLTTGVNVSATMTVGTGATLTFSGSGVNNASQINGVTVTGTPATGKIPIATSSSAAVWADPVVSGPDANAAVPSGNPLVTAGWDGTNVRRYLTDSTGLLKVNVTAGLGNCTATTINAHQYCGNNTASNGVAPGFVVPTISDISGGTSANNYTLTGQNALTAFAVDNIVTIDGNLYPCTAAGFNSAIATLPSTGGIVDARGCTTAITGQTTTVSVGDATTKYGVTLLMPSTTYSGSANPLFFVNSRSLLYLQAGTLITQTAAAANGVIVGSNTAGGTALSGGIDGRGAILGPGIGTSTGAGLILGGTSDPGNSTSNSANYVYIGPITITGFANGEVIGQTVYSVKHDHTQLYNDASPLSMPSTSINSSESIVFESVNFARATTYATMTLSASTEIYFRGSCSFDGVFIVVNATGGVRIYFDAPHFEFVDGATNTDILTVSGNTAHIVQIFGGEIVEDTASTRTEFITMSTGYLYMAGVAVLPAENVAAVVTANGSSNVNIVDLRTNNVNTYLNGNSTGGQIVNSTLLPGAGNSQLRLSSLNAATNSGNVALGTFQMSEFTAPTAAGSNETCYGDSTAHALECNYNNTYPAAATFGKVPLVNVLPIAGSANSNVFRVTGDFTDASSTALQTITGLSFVLPANTAANYSVECHLAYSQATLVADAFGIQAASLAPTNIFATGLVQLSANTPPTTFAGGTLATLATTTATNILAFTPTAAGTVMRADLYALVENPSGVANTINIMVSQTTAADVIIVKRGSYCRVY